MITQKQKIPIGVDVVENIETYREFLKCRGDAAEFARHYGLIDEDQAEQLREIQNNRFPSYHDKFDKLTAAYITWMIVSKMEAQIAIVGSTINYGKIMLREIDLMLFHNIPKSIRPNIVRRTQSCMEFENFNRIIIGGSSDPNWFRGMSIDCLISNRQNGNAHWKRFDENVIPAMASRNDPQMIVVT